MTLLQLLDKYSEEVLDQSQSNMKTSYIFTSQELETNANGVVIYSYCYDNRRGVWITKFECKGVPVAVQICAGREGDDAIILFVLDGEWFTNLADSNGTSIKVSKYGNVVYLGDLGVDITEDVIKEIGRYGTSYEEKRDHILKVLTIDILKDKHELSKDSTEPSNKQLNPNS